MGKYGIAAKHAVMLVAEGLDKNPRSAWEKVILKDFQDSKSSQDKNCPKSTFLALCEAGLVQGIVAGSYTGSVKNKKYALNAVGHLKRNPELVADENKLWMLAIEGKDIKENSQMDVVITLWSEGLIKR
ncbi:DUF6979 family protein [Methylovulum psychrotolerans]|uniref:Uncharacterized protein n=1 Tax=Methylovulum psychrotolerans TaxID=1704499 RepID=A0A1Z4C3I6_9GAMM|nr:hypothetical protein [Methylovulum psychrotolerans]ASF48101.1 hypothetical protein CEK71_19650 [Methylovulum psychrotolerans]MBT9099885.1 hypothetical protein [Methylovulum psychrotolerans]